MMFGQYLILGSWIVTLATYLMSSPARGGLNFPAADAAWIYSTTAFAGIVAPLFIGLLADRLFAAEKLMGVLHLLGAVLLGVAGWWCFDRQPQVAAAYRAAAASEIIEGIPVLEWEQRILSNPQAPSLAEQRQVAQSLQRVNESPEVIRQVRETFLPLLLLMSAYSFCLITTLALGNVVAYRNLPDPQHTFSRVRLFGTVGWIVAGLQIELFLEVISAAPLFSAAGLSAVLGLYCFTLPRTPPAGQSRSLGEAFGLPALSMFRESSFGALIFCALGIAVVQQFYTVYANRFLTEMRLPHPAAVQTVAQVAEVLCMLLLPFALRRLGVKLTILLGILGWVARNAIFATGQAAAIIGIGLPLHGLSYTFFFIVASMYVDRHAPPHLRASAQGIFTFVASGAGPLLGNWLSAKVVQSNTMGDSVSWPTVWLVPAGISGLILLICLVLFHDSQTRPFLSRPCTDDNAKPSGGFASCDPTPSSAP
jgi:nucleoside transporter